MRILIQVGWAVLISVGTLLVFLLLAVGASLSVSDAIVATILVDVVILALGLLLRRYKPSWISYDGEPASFDTRTGFAVVGLLALVFITGQAAATAIYDSYGSAGFDATKDANAGSNPLLVIALVLLIAPMAEEMLLRGLAYPLLRRRLPVIASALITAGIFALIHSNLIQAVAVVPLGVVLALMYEHTRSIWPGVLAHATYNLAATLIPKVVVEALTTPLSLLCLGLLTSYGFIVVITRILQSTRVHGPDLVENQL